MGYNHTRYKSEGIYNKDGVQVSSLDKEELLNLIVDMLSEDGYSIIESQDEYHKIYGIGNE